MALAGAFYTLLMFLCCFALVHLVKLARIGLDSLKPKPEQREEPDPEPKKKAQRQVQPVYYIVEKKRARKSSYSAPREITFKDGGKAK